MSFVNDILSGKAKEEDIDDYIEKWHTDESITHDLSDYLGMTKQEYSIWLTKPEYIKVVIEKRQWS